MEENVNLRKVCIAGFFNACLSVCMCACVDTHVGPQEARGQAQVLSSGMLSASFDPKCFLGLMLTN